MTTWQAKKFGSCTLTGRYGQLDMSYPWLYVLLAVEIKPHFKNTHTYTHTHTYQEKKFCLNLCKLTLRTYVHTQTFNWPNQCPSLTAHSQRNSILVLWHNVYMYKSCIPITSTTRHLSLKYHSELNYLSELKYLSDFVYVYTICISLWWWGCTISCMLNLHAEMGIWFIKLYTYSLPLIQFFWTKYVPISQRYLQSLQPFNLYFRTIH